MQNVYARPGMALPPAHEEPDEEEYDGEEIEDITEDQGGEEEEQDRRFSGPSVDAIQDQDGRPVFHPSVVQQSSYEIEPIKIIYDASRDESLPQIVFYIMNSNISREAKMRHIAKAACYLSKNHVYSYLTDTMDFMRAQDDYEMSKVISRFGLTSFDRNIDYLHAETLIEAEHSIRLRRSRNALNLQQLNTQRTENINTENPVAQHEERKLRQKIPLLGGYL